MQGKSRGTGEGQGRYHNPAHERKGKKQAAIEQQRAERELAKNSFEAVAREWMEQQGERWSRGHARAVQSNLERSNFKF